MTPLGASVLQDNWVSVTSGSEDYSFKVPFPPINMRILSKVVWVQEEILD